MNLRFIDLPFLRMIRRLKYVADELLKLPCRNFARYEGAVVVNKLIELEQPLHLSL